MSEVEDDKPFVCLALGCQMRFTNEDHLNVHTKKHEMSLALNPGGHSSSPGLHILDQTPTPTKFLKNCEEIGLFQELSKNPFEEAFKKASDSDGVPLPGPQSNELNTPIPLPLHDKSAGSYMLHDDKIQSPTPSSAGELLKQHSIVLPSEALALDLTGQKLQEKVAMLPSSTTTEDEEGSIISLADSTQSPSKSLPSAIPVSTREVVVTHAVSSSVVGSVSRPQMTIAPQTVSGQSMMLQQHVLTTTTSSGLHQQPQLTTTSPPTSAGQSCTMQVYLQLPTGQTVPVHIPATINPMLSGATTGDVSQQALQQLATTAIAATASQQQPVKLATRQVTTPSASNSSMALKQRLKQTLQAQQQQHQQQQQQQQLQQQQQSIVSSSSIKIEPNLVGTSLQHSPLVLSPSVESIIAELEPMSKRPKSSPTVSESDDPDERRRKFLERNRAAAARCRQKRKYWICNLEKKADELQATNTRLQGEVSLLRGEVAQLKTLLLAHQDCPITLQQKSQGQLALHTISMVESTSGVPFDISQLVSSCATTTVTIDSHQLASMDTSTYAMSASDSTSSSQ